MLFQNYFRLWPLLWSNNLWPAPITMGLLYSLRWTYITNMKFGQVVLFHLSCLQACLHGFKTFTSVAVKWPLTCTNYNKVLVLTKVNLHAKYEVWSSYNVFRLLTSVAVKWPCTSTNFNRVLSKVDLHTKYDVWTSCTFSVTNQVVLFQL